MWVATRAEQRGAGQADQTFVLYDGRHYRGVPGSGEFQMTQFSEGGYPIHLGELSGRRGDPGLKGSEVVEFSPPAAVAARMFGMNFSVWRERPEVTESHSPEELDAIAKGLGRVATAPEDAAPITWRMRQIVLGPA